MELTLRERKKQRARLELATVALRLFREQGFEATTVEEIADAAEYSASTFFRYFGSKEDVVFAFLDQWALRLADDIVARPAGEDPVAAVQHSFRQLTAAYEGRSLALVRLVRRTPALRTQEHINREHLRLVVVDALGRRLGVDPGRDLRPHVLATIAFAALDAAMVTWFGARSDEDIQSLLDEALAAFGRELRLICARL